MKASNVVAPAKATKAAPDLEEAFEEEDDGDIVAEVKDGEDDIDLKKDKYIKQPKAKKVAAKKGAPRKKAAKSADDEDDDSDEDVNPKKGKAKAKPKAKK